MFENDALENELKYSHTIENNQAVWIEWNLNQSYNIEKVGNYRYRPGTTDVFYSVIRNIYEPTDPVDLENNFKGYYTGATDSDIIINAGFDDSNDPAFYVAPKKKINLLYSLDDCFKQNRPRSGINKLLYLGIPPTVINQNGVGTSRGQYIDSLNTFRQIKNATISGASSFENEITYVAQHNFLAGDYVKVSGINPSVYNFSDIRKIIEVTSNTFTVAGSASVPYQSGGIAQVGYLATSNVARRPRYYMSSRYDDFKYWTSYRTEVDNGITNEFGIAQNINTGTTPASYYIYDAAPFVIYKEKLATNRVTIKMQTNVGEINNGPYRIGANTNILDPLYGFENQTTPKRWAVQKLNANNQWVEIISFTESSVRNDGTPIIKSDGHVELEYGLLIPELYKDTFTLVGEISSISQRPSLAPYGYAYLYKQNNTDKGILYISDGGNWQTFIPEYKWALAGTDITKNTKVLTDATNPSFYIENSSKIYREFDFVNGLRIVVDTMNKVNSTFDLIELSPRLVANITSKTISYSVNKTLADLGNYSMPTGNLIAATGEINIFDYDLAFNENNIFDEETNEGSIISQYSNGRMKFIFYDIVKNVDSYDYYIPVKTLYAEKMPQVSDNVATLNIQLRDLFYLLESKKSPELLLTNVSLSYAITVLLDSIGFSNYSFKRLQGEDELIIPFFFVGPDQNIAETLQQLAVSSQSAIFFDEYNDLIIMSKNYILPRSEEDRKTDLTLYGQEEQISITQNGQTIYKTALPNIINISSQDKLVYNGGEINYTNRYIQKTIGSISQAPYIDEYKTYIYKPVLLWEVAGQENIKTVNESATQAGGYSLAAMPIKTTLTKELPKIGYEIYTITHRKRETFENYDIVTIYGTKPNYIIVGSQITVSGISSQIDGTWVVSAVGENNSISYITKKYGEIPYGTCNGTFFDADQPIDNNIIDFGESVYWLGNYFGYFYANGEIIRYDAVEYSVAGVGNVWIKNNQEYQSYFARLRFNGKMYPTGRVRIYTKIQDNVIKEHGRGQFGTEVVEHSSGLTAASSWINDSNVRGSIQNSQEYLFNTNKTLSYPDDIGISDAGKIKYINNQPYNAQSYAIKSTRNGIIKNFMANTNLTESDVTYYKSARSGSVQTSALIFNGPPLPNEINSSDFVTYAYKSLEKPFKHFGTRLRIIGKIESGTNKSQSPVGSFPIYSLNSATSENPTQQVSISGGSGGIAFGLNKDTNVGYYFEIVALSQDNISSYKNNSNVASYSIRKSPVIQVVNNSVIATLSTQHDFEVGETIAVSGVVDDNRKTAPASSINGEFTVTEISSDRKSFKYVIPSPPSTTANITAVSRSGSGTNWTITYTANNSFSPGQIINITGLSPSAYNISGAVIASATSTQFTVNVSSDFGTVTDNSGSASYVVLTTTSSSGGTVVKNLDEDTTISNVFFYKVVSGSNTADIIKKERTGNVVKLTTLRDHSFIAGESIIITNVDPLLNGTYVIDSVAEKTIQYKTSASGTINSTDLDPIGLATGVNKIAIPYILWRGLTEVIVDDGKFTTQSRLTTSEKTTVYDLSAEYLDIGTTRQFYLYLNNKQIAIVTDTNPLPQYNNLALFIRGGSKVMFENVYALSDNFATNNAKTLQLPISKIFGDDVISESEAIKKYAISGIVQNTYLSGISSQTTPAYDIYYEEFGTIMREAAYFNIRYDRAYPALYAQLAPTLNRVRGYTVSGFFAGSYGAEFLIFNAIDKNLNLDDTTGNYLRILGIAFTQNTTHSLKVDDFFKKNSNFTDAIYSETDAKKYQALYADILNSRSKYGKNDFSIDTQYVQTDAAAESMMNWIIEKIIYPRKTVGVTTFATPHLQLGDIVNINYNNSGVDIVTTDTTRFVVYSIQYQKDNGNVSTTVYLAEV
jgi:hypothetical protein